eukprot:2885835-Pleurochrysis_carterae.AAC.1
MAGSRSAGDGATLSGGSGSEVFWAVAPAESEVGLSPTAVAPMLSSWRSEFSPLAPWVSLHHRRISAFGSMAPARVRASSSTRAHSSPW